MGALEGKRTVVTASASAPRCVGRASPAEIASIAVFLAAEASYITGQILYAYGGRMALNYTAPVAE
jgi:NAD(P)-dependent dehydrogenase (short-subunit alcohol dehydrogenase family)